MYLWDNKLVGGIPQQLGHISNLSDQRLIISSFDFDLLKQGWCGFTKGPLILRITSSSFAIEILAL